MKVYFSVFLFLVVFSSYSQELNCNVRVEAPSVQGDKKVFETMETAIFEFMNNTKWTKDIYSNDERIECSITINITERMSTDEFKATIQIQARRPVFKSSYNAPLLNHNDNDFQFRYLEFQPLEFSENTHTSNLTSILAYYAYVILGLDYDSFSLNGGTAYYQKAQAIVNNAQNVNEKGWKAFESDRNRYWLTENLLNAIFAPLRQCIYNYHRNGLDVMAEDKDAGREAIFESVSLLTQVYNNKPNSYNLQIVFTTKSDELVNIFSQSYPDQKAKVINLLNEIDPANSNKYQKIMNTE